MSSEIDTVENVIRNFVRHGVATADGLADGTTVVCLWDPTAAEGMNEPNDFWRDSWIQIMGRDLKDQRRMVMGWVQATGVLTVAPAFINPNVSLLSANVLALAVTIPVVDASVFRVGEAYIWDAVNAEAVTITVVDTVLNQLTIAPGLVNPYTVAAGAAISMSRRITDGTHFRLQCSEKLTSGAVVLVSGQTVKISGEVVQISGQHIYQESGAVVLVSGQTVIAKISGDTVIAKVSGEAVKVSGETVIGKVSGEVVQISGQAVKVSGETVVAKISGETLSIYTPTEVKTGALRIVGAASGGVVLHSGAVLSVTVKAVTLSGDIYVGGETNRPYSGFGLVLQNKEATNIDIDDFNRIYIFATVSGDRVSFAGVT